jgi:hypothetical protein
MPPERGAVAATGWRVRAADGTAARGGVDAAWHTPGIIAILFVWGGTMFAGSIMNVVEPLLAGSLQFSTIATGVDTPRLRILWLGATAAMGAGQLAWHPSSRITPASPVQTPMTVSFASQLRHGQRVSACQLARLRPGPAKGRSGSDRAEKVG